MAHKRTISVVIPNYNGETLLRDYLPATFEALDHAGINYEVIVVDDGSKDNSVLLLKSHYPKVVLIQNPENRGFSYSCNRGIALAQYELIFLLNSDVKLLRGYFEPLWKYFDRDDTFGVTGRIIDMDCERIQDAARMPGFNGFKIKSKYFYYCNNPGDELYTFYLSGANALVNTEKLKALGGFDELFSPFYGEDLDLGIRAWRNGWKCYYEHQAICRHQQSATTKNYKTPAWVKQVYFRNRFFVHALHLNRYYHILWFIQITLIDLLPKILTGKFWIWKSYTDLLTQRSKINLSQQKNELQMARSGSKVSLLDVFAILRNAVKDKETIKFKV